MLDGSDGLCVLCQNAITMGGRRCASCQAVVCPECIEGSGMCYDCEERFSQAPTATDVAAYQERGGEGGLDVGPSVHDDGGDNSESVDWFGEWV